VGIYTHFEKDGYTVFVGDLKYSFTESDGYKSAYQHFLIEVQHLCRNTGQGWDVAHGDRSIYMEKPPTEEIESYYESDGDEGNRTHYIVATNLGGSSPRFESKLAAINMEKEFHARGSRLTRKDFYHTMAALADELGVRTY